MKKRLLAKLCVASFLFGGNCNAMPTINGLVKCLFGRCFKSKSKSNDKMASYVMATYVWGDKSDQKQDY